MAAAHVRSPALPLPRAPTGLPLGKLPLATASTKRGRANERFAAGRLTTNFIPEEYPDGYSGHALSSTEHADLLACTAALQCAVDAQQASVGGAAPALTKQYGVRLSTEGEAETNVRA